MKKLDIKQLEGTKHNKLTILKECEPHITKGGHKRRVVLCRCVCGVEKRVQISSILNGSVKSCGCYSRKMSSERMKKQGTHNMYRTPEYNIWMSMKKRCLNKSHKSYHLYGGRGISVCDKWMGFSGFIEDVGLRPSKNHSLDRIDNNGNYEPQNVRWATRREQQRNKRNNRLITYNGETKCLSEWVAKHPHS